MLLAEKDIPACFFGSCYVENLSLLMSMLFMHICMFVVVHHLLERQKQSIHLYGVSFYFIFKLFQFPFPTTNGHMCTYSTIAYMHVAKWRPIHLCIFMCNAIPLFYQFSFSAEWH